jgi:hypothetical protein
MPYDTDIVRTMPMELDPVETHLRTIPFERGELELLGCADPISVAVR